MNHSFSHILNLRKECLLCFQLCLVMVAGPLELIDDCIEGSVGPGCPLQALGNAELLAVDFLCDTVDLGSQLLREYLVQKQSRRKQANSKEQLSNKTAHCFKHYMYTILNTSTRSRVERDKVVPS